VASATTKSQFFSALHQPAWNCFYNHANLQRPFESRCLWLPFVRFESFVKILQIWTQMLSFSLRDTVVRVRKLLFWS